MAESGCFSPELLDKKLRSLRIRAGLTQAEVAERMGLTGESSGNVVGHLEQGRIKNPSVRTLTLFLHACGALWSEITGVLDSRELVPIDTKAITDSELSPEDKQRLEWAVNKQVRKFETKLAMPIGAKPLHPLRQAEAVRKFRNYRIVVTLMEQAVAELLADKPVVSIEYPRYKAVAREAVGLLWREARRDQESKVKSQNGQEDGEFRLQTAECKVQDGGLVDELAEKVEYWQMQKVDGKLVREVQEVVVRRFAALRETNPELF